jgi:short-subunit dehydrogenase
MSDTKKYALITGATSGIGYELAKLFAQDNYNLVIVAREQGELDATAKELSSHGVEVVTLAKDLFVRENAFAVYSEVKAKGIEIDVLVNNAGQGAYGLFQDNDIEKELNIIDLNIAATIILTKAFLKDMVTRNKGKVLNLASIASTTPGPWHAVYHGTKAFVLSFTEALRSEVKDNEITVTALLPGATNTDFFNKADMTDSKAVQDKDSLSDPADVAKDGYDALLAGKDKVVSGFKNKVTVTMGNITPDTLLADQMKNQQEPVNK